MPKFTQDSTVLVRYIKFYFEKVKDIKLWGILFCFQSELLGQPRAVIPVRHRYIATRLQPHLLFPVTLKSLVSEQHME